MPLIKQITDPTGKVYAYHTIDIVEFVRFGNTPSWRARYSSYVSPINMKESTSGTLTGVPIVQSSDPIGAYEQACITDVNCMFYGAEIVLAGDQPTIIEWEKKSKILSINSARDAELNGGFNTAYGRFSSDTTALLNFIGTAVIAKDMPSTWATEWTLDNDSYVTLTRDQFLEVAGVLGVFRATTYAKGRTLVDSINAATTVEEVRAITW